MLPVSSYFIVDDCEIHVTEWGNVGHPCLIMWHGLSRTGRDFDTLAAHFSKTHYVLCPDTLGRGLSSWASNPDKQYSFEFYEKVAQRLCAHFNISKTVFLGTSMGGALGIRLASGPLKDHISALIVNDIAPQLAPTAVERILEYVSHPPKFSRMSELESYLRTIYKPFGKLTDEEWRLMCDTSSRRCRDGVLTLHYDPKITRQFINYPDDYNLWARFETLTLPILVIRGEESDLMLKEWAERMKNTGSHIRFKEIEGCGHAPALNTKDQISMINEFILSV